MLLINFASQALLYLCLSVLTGSFILFLVPPSRKPNIVVPKGVLVGAIAGIVVFSFIPVLKLVFYMMDFMELRNIFLTVVTTFEVGKAWLFTFIVAVLFIMYIFLFDIYKHSYIGIVFTLLFILSLGWSGHTASLDPVKGFIAHSLHAIVVSIWVGILFIVSWFSKNDEHWLCFLKWFTPVAIVCFVSTMISGLTLMNFVMDFQDYSSSWQLPYGQALLMKHILILPLLLIAFFNGFFVKKKITLNPAFNPIPWARAESILILLIFTATAILGEQPPPYETAVLMKGLVSQL